MAEPAKPEPFRPLYRNYVLFVLFLGYVVNALDRAILGILLPSIQVEFDLSNTQLGLLGGVAFALFYATCGIPIASLADRTSRKWILGVFALPLIVGWTRTYLGVHYPTDVIGGWSLGALWVIALDAWYVRVDVSVSVAATARPD